MKEKAKNFATRAHAGQLRKNTLDPYITHPIRVAKRLEDSGFKDELVAAGYLHDVVEDTPVELGEIKNLFGEEVAAFVAAHTEDKTKSWKERKQHTINTIKTASKEVTSLIVADRLDNLLSVEEALAEQGNAVWDHFNAGLELQKWYNISIVENMYGGIESNAVADFFHEYEDVVERVFD